MRSLPQLGRPNKNGYRCSKGFVDKDGKLTQKFFWLGHDARLAMEKLIALDSIAESLPTSAEGKRVWGETSLAQADAAFKFIASKQTCPPDPSFAAFSVPQPPASQPVFAPQPLPPRADLAHLALHDALDQYVAHVDSKNEIGVKTKTMTQHRIRSLKHHLPDLPLSGIQFEQLQSFRNTITARPLCRRQRIKGAGNEPIRRISIMTTRNWLSTLGQAFRWFRKTNRWVMPVGIGLEELQQLFFLSKVERSRLCTDRDERQKLDKPKPSPILDELCVYYRLATPGQRLYLLMGICLGWRQRQIANLRKQDLVQRRGEYYINFERTKTGVEGELWVCPELAEMLIARIAKTPANPDNFALLTVNDMPLVHTTMKGHDTDSIKLVWNSLRGKAAALGCRSLPFDSLRRFAAQAITNLGDPFLAQVFLAQVPESVLEQHYAGRGVEIGIGTTAFEKVHDVQRKVYATLKPLFDSVAIDTETLMQRISGVDAAAQRTLPRTAA